jgi:hypothetical protein
MAMTQQGGSSGNVDLQRVRALMEQLQQLPTAGPKADPAKRDQLLDELQDLVGLAGKMVMENDIIRRAKQLLGER